MSASVVAVGGGVGGGAARAPAAVVGRVSVLTATRGIRNYFLCISRHLCVTVLCNRVVSDC